MNEVMNMSVVGEQSLGQELVKTMVDTFSQLPKEFQMAVIGATLFSVVGLTAYGISKGYGVKKGRESWELTNNFT